MEKKKQHKIHKGEPIKFKEANLFGSRENIDEALEYLEEISGSIDTKDSSMYLITAYYVLWNTLAKHYVIYEKSDDEKTREFNEAIANRIAESKYK